MAGLTGRSASERTRPALYRIDSDGAGDVRDRRGHVPQALRLKGETTMRIIDLTLKDLMQLLRDKRSLLFMVAMPIVFTLFMGFAYKGNGDETASDTRIALGWVNNEPDGLLSQQLYTLLSDSGDIKLVDLTLETANEAVRKGEVAGALIVPAGFSEGLAGSPVQLTLV